MTILQVGLGSMGKRRIRNFLFHGVNEDSLFGFDLNEERRKEVEEQYGIKTFASFSDAVDIVHPDIFSISTPPNHHSTYYLYAAKNKKHFFVEATTHDDGYERLLGLLDGSFVAAPSCTFRYFPAVKKIKEILAQGTLGSPLTFSYHLGQYLPDWHPWEDYRKVYFSQKETGACREMLPFELIWLTGLFDTKVSSILGIKGKVSHLEMSADDVYAASVKFSNNIIGTILIDVVARYPFRTLRIMCEEGVIEWDWMSYQIKVYNSSSGQWDIISLQKGESEVGYETTEDMYREEIQHFLAAVSGEFSYPYTFFEDWDILKALYTFEKIPDFVY
ncbi:MAG: hypothetical protein COU30_03815 [Candidatus Magasanikbacteria bacterium CG10_big_fil_rev_8_21_14_0_10_38_6]|uniref:Uncharacterized protein n=1 Tax=Candidatus Magasanikbacteria bacterium CG10_big_fil_rev_8_21_14_0_10_38_6 TaxID=1974647 RepID=A0A2M6P0G9_9BACT|nr:MAG: hypothetical protein COU30_03815 [Candidatus Magasanikbacteria bacterium CG10_big_fil_rev_8_21_14_0_10_38_6]